MEKQKYAKIVKIILLVLIVLSVAVLLWGMIKGYPATVAEDNGNGSRR